MSEPIAIIPKNSIDEIRVMWSEYKGRRYLDIRVYTLIDGKADKAPTKKGVTVRPDQIPELIKALEGARSVTERVLPHARVTAGGKHAGMR